MESSNPLGGTLQSAGLWSGQAAQRRSEILFANLELRDRACPHAVKAARVGKHRRITALAHIRDDRAHHALNRRFAGHLVEGQRCKLRVKTGLARGKAAQFHAVFPRRAATMKESMTGCSSARRVFRAAWLTTRRADTGMISSTGTSLLARSVLPLDTRSTIASASPSSGASSIEP